MTTFGPGAEPDEIRVETNGDIIFNSELIWDNTAKVFKVSGKIAHRSFQQLTTSFQAIGSSDTIITFGDVSTDSVWDITAGIITAKVTIPGSTAKIEMHIDKSGGGGTVGILCLWREVSTDGGSTFTPVPNTLREVSISNDGDGNFLFGASVDEPIPAGTKFKVVAKNVGSGTLVLESPTTTNADTEVVTGFSAKLTIG